MTTTAHEDQFTSEPEPVRQPYDTGSILRRNVVDLELALKQQTERAEAAEEKLTTAREDMQSWIDSRNGWMERAGAAEAELARLREQEQEPIKYLYRVIDCFGHDVLRDDPKDATILETIPLYASPVPVPHKGATHCDDCGLTWLDDGLNPLGCPYCKDTVPAPAVPEFCAVEAQLTLAETEMLNAKAWSAGTQAKRHIDFAMTAICCARALLQSAEVQAGDKWQLTPAPTHPADRNAGEVRHD